MRFRLEQRFAHPLGAVRETLFDPGFIEALGALPRLGEPELLEQAEEGGSLRRRVRYRFAGDLSPAVTAILDPDRLTWVEETTLDLGTHRAQHRVLPDHYAGRLRCGYSSQLLADGPAATTRLVEGEVTVRFALVGGKVERAIVSGLKQHAQAEAELLHRRLAGPPVD